MQRLPARRKTIIQEERHKKKMNIFEQKFKEKYIPDLFNEK